MNNIIIEDIKRMAIYRKWLHSGLTVQQFVNSYQPVRPQPLPELR